MKIRRILAAATSLLMMAACVTSCQPKNNEEEPPKPPKEVQGRYVNEFVTGETGLTTNEDGSVTYDLTTANKFVENVRFLGRTYATDYVKYSDGQTINGVTCFNWTDAGFEIVFNGTEISAEIVASRYDIEPVFLYVAVDGNEDPDACNYINVSQNEVDTYVLASGLTDGEHIITVRRSTRGCMGNFGQEKGLSGISALKSITVKGSAPAMLGKVYDRDIQLEFIGDSITCGDNIFMSVDINGNSTKIEDGYRTYAGYCARELNADYNVMAISGNGFICSLFGTELLDLPDQYEYTCSLSLGSTDDVKWDFSKYQPDVVIVNLGTNDISGLNTGNYTEDDIKYGVTKSVKGGEVKRHTGVFDFLDMIHKNNPDAKIVWLCGAMGVRLSDIISEAVTEWNQQNNTDIASFKQLVDCGTVENGKAYDNSHPSETYGKTYGKELADYIKNDVLKLNDNTTESTAE